MKVVSDFLEGNHRRKWRFFTLNGTWLGLYGRGALAEDAKVSPEGSGFESFALAHNVCSESEVDEVVNRALEAGATLVKKPEKVSWGGYSGYFKDPGWSLMGGSTQSTFLDWPNRRWEPSETTVVEVVMNGIPAGRRTVIGKSCPS